MKVCCKCPQCGTTFLADAGAVNRARKVGYEKFCGRKCAGIARRLKNPLSHLEKKEAKRIYDIQYRQKNLDALKKKKAERFKVYYKANAEKFKAERKRRMSAHVEYCRDPKYKEYKREYDKKKEEKKYADFAEAWRLLQQLEKEILDRASSYERRVMNGYYTRAAQRLRSERWQMRKALRQLT